jgi:antitoxin ParD1/3/4
MTFAAITDIDNLRYRVYPESIRERLLMSVSLTPELEEFVTTKVQSARYTSASEVVREALRLLEEHDSARAAQLTEFNQELGRRLAALDRGEVVDPAAARARVQRKSEQRRKLRV